jgi:dihydrodipicolinate synthase/N-acetylneuraminate lyase
MSLPLLTRADYAKTVIAVPPIALTEDGRVSAAENRRIMRHIADGGIPVLLYGGNANLYHFGLDLYREAVDVLHAELPAPVSILFSAGPGFGTALDHVKVLRQAGVRSVMLLPTAFPSDQVGVGAGVRRIADALGNGIVLYIKRENYVAPDGLARLIDDGAVTFVKYAVERTEPADDAYLDRLVEAVGTGVIASGMAETPIADHVGRRRLAAFSS